MSDVTDTPLMQQYKEIKSRNRDAILFFRMGDFYEMFFEDAHLAARLLNITLTSRGDGVPLAGVPVKAAADYLRQLIAAGQRVAICEQVEDPRLARGIVRREVIETITPGAVLDEGSLTGGRNNFLAAIGRTLKDSLTVAGGRADGRTEIVPQAEFERLAEEGRFLEIWNLVFMQFDRAADGTLTPLPKPSVDTGAGLERIAAVLQGEDSNFHTDLFLPLLERAAKLAGKPYDRGPGGASFRVLADHARAVSFLLADGVYPGNEGRGYVLRRILRRAVRHAWLLGRREPTLAPLTSLVVEQMGPVYPELVEKRQFIADVTR
ncbi:MAG: alanine--tRNA ligase-related protein, partial [Gemmatimonadales bacterium]